MPQVLERPSASPVMVWHYSDRPKLSVGLTTEADSIVCKKAFMNESGQQGAVTLHHAFALKSGRLG
jgi:hypothetical protein